MLTTNQKGVLAEAKIVACAIELGLGVSRPLDDERYDLILDLRPALLRVQCKWAARIGAVVSGRLYTGRRGPQGLINRRVQRGRARRVRALLPGRRLLLSPPGGGIRRAPAGSPAARPVAQ